MMPNHPVPLPLDEFGNNAFMLICAGKDKPVRAISNDHKNFATIYPLRDEENARWEIRYADKHSEFFNANKTLLYRVEKDGTKTPAFPPLPD